MWVWRPTRQPVWRPALQFHARRVGNGGGGLEPESVWVILRHDESRALTLISYLKAILQEPHWRGDSDAHRGFGLSRRPFPGFRFASSWAIIDGPSGANSSPCVRSVAAPGQIIAVRKFDGRSGPNHCPCNRISQEAPSLEFSEPESFPKMNFARASRF